MRKTLKFKIIGGISIVLLSLSLFACDDESDSSSGKASKEEGSVAKKSEAVKESVAAKESNDAKKNSVIILDEEEFLEQPEYLSDACVNISHTIKRQDCIDSLKQNFATVLANYRKELESRIGKTETMVQSIVSVLSKHYSTGAPQTCTVYEKRDEYGLRKIGMYCGESMSVGTLATLFENKYFMEGFNRVEGIVEQRIFFPDKEAAINFKPCEKKECEGKYLAILKKIVVRYNPRYDKPYRYEAWEYVGTASAATAEENPAVVAVPAPTAEAAETAQATDYSSALQTNFPNGELGANKRSIEVYFQSVSKSGDSYSVSGYTKTKAAEDKFSGSLTVSGAESGGACGGGQTELTGTYSLDETQSKTSGKFAGSFTACESGGTLTSAKFTGNWIKHTDGKSSVCNWWK